MSKKGGGQKDAKLAAKPGVQAVTAPKQRKPAEEIGRYLGALGRRAQRDPVTGLTKIKIDKTDIASFEKEEASSRRYKSKADLMITWMLRPQGATLAELATATTWARPSVRAAISTKLRKGLGLRITVTDEGDRRRVYRICRQTRQTKPIKT
jgi:hypothetical protein